MHEAHVFPFFTLIDHTPSSVHTVSTYSVSPLFLGLCATLPRGAASLNVAAAAAARDHRAGLLPWPLYSRTLGDRHRPPKTTARLRSRATSTKPWLQETTASWIAHVLYRGLLTRVQCERARAAESARGSGRLFKKKRFGVRSRFFAVGAFSFQKIQDLKGAAGRKQRSVPRQRNKDEGVGED